MSIRTWLERNGITGLGGGPGSTLSFEQNIAAAGSPLPVSTPGDNFWLDPVNGDDDNSGLSPALAVKTLAAAYALTTNNHNDVVNCIGGATELVPTAALNWSNSYTHFLGWCADNPDGMRCRIEASAAADLANILTISGNGCIFKNLKLANAKDANSATNTLVVSGARNHLINVFAAGPIHATPAARNDSMAMSLTGEENRFTNCSFGVTTIVRGAAYLGEVQLSGDNKRNYFDHCFFSHYCETAAVPLVNVLATSDWTIFEDCLFHNFSVNWANTKTDAILIAAGLPTYSVILRGQGNQLSGITGWSDNVTRINSAQAQSNAGFGVKVSPTT